MAVYYNKDITYLVGSEEVAQFAKSATLSGECVPLDTTPLSTTGWVTVIGGNKSGTFDLSLMADFADDGLDERLQAYFATADVPQSLVFGQSTTDGSLAYTWKALGTSYVPMQGAPGELAMAQFSGVSSSGPIARGLLIHPSTARTSSSTGTAHQVGAVSSTQRLYASLHVLSASGTSPTLDVKVQSDTVGFGSATDRITFTQATASTNLYQASSVAGAITDDYWRVSYTIGGSSTPTFSFMVCVGIA